MHGDLTYDSVQLKLMEEMCINVDLHDDIIGPISKKNGISFIKVNRPRSRTDITDVQDI